MVAIASLPTTVTPRRPALTVVPPRRATERRATGRPLRSLVVAAALAVAVLLALTYLITTPAAGTGTVVPATSSYVAAPGDTMWSIAVAHAPAGEAAAYVEQLVAANGGATVSTGQVVTLPAP